jgi:iron-sulfur cluster assembly accessory protein
MITLTPNAAKKIKELASKKGLAQAALRVKVGAGGCSGMEYQFLVTDELAKDDVIFEKDGAKTVVDPRSDFFIGGSEVDYTESMMESGFKIQNPQAKASCSCGKSFTV